MFDRWLVISDMDGTLLNHHDYRFKAALPILQRLEDSAIPVIFNTSKTFEELKDWVSLLNNKHPFIVENGSAIYIPEGYFPASFQKDYLADAKTETGYRVLITGVEVEAIQKFVSNLKPEAIDLSRCSLQQAVDITGLTESEALAAQTRQFSVPLMFKDAIKQQTFSEQAKEAGFGVLKGGRFLHILGLCDKGQSMQVLKNLYENFYRESFGLIVLGDSPNDEAMLKQANHPVIVNSPSSDSIELEHPAVICTRDEAPEGWVEGLELVLDKENIKLKQEK